MSARRYTSSGGGAGNGRSWRDARPFAALAGDLAAAQAGDTFLIGFDPGRESPIVLRDAALQLARSGAPGRPIRIAAGAIGRDGGLQTLSDSFHQFISPGGARAAPGARLRLMGASHVALSGFAIAGASNDGFVKFAGEGRHSDIEIAGFRARDCGRVLETGREASVSGLVVRDCAARRLVRGFARFRRLDRAVFSDLTLDAAGLDGGESNPCQLIAVAAGEDLRFERILFANAVNPREDYVQGDGLVCERNVRTVTIGNCRAVGMGDGGFDLKARGVRMERCIAERCKYGLRIWSGEGNLVRACSFRQPRRYGRHGGACVEAHGAADLVDCEFEAGREASVFSLSSGEARLRVRGGAIRLRDGAPLVVGPAGAWVELDDVAVNGELRSGRVAARGEE